MLVWFGCSTGGVIGGLKGRSERRRGGAESRVLRGGEEVRGERRGSKAQDLAVYEMTIFILVGLPSTAVMYN